MSLLPYLQPFKGETILTTSWEETSQPDISLIYYRIRSQIAWTDCLDTSGTKWNSELTNTPIGYSTVELLMVVAYDMLRPFISCVNSPKGVIDTGSRQLSCPEFVDRGREAHSC